MAHGAAGNPRTLPDPSMPPGCRQAAPRRHHHLHRDVATRRRARRGQPGPGFPDFPVPGRLVDELDTRDARRPQPVRDDDRHARAAPRHRRQDRARLRLRNRMPTPESPSPAARPGDLRRHPRGGARGRGSDRARPCTTATNRRSTSPGRRRCTCALDPRTFAPDWRGARGDHAEGRGC